jgi:hypothetical protein
VGASRCAEEHSALSAHTHQKSIGGMGKICQASRPCVLEGVYSSTLHCYHVTLSARLVGRLVARQSGTYPDAYLQLTTTADDKTCPSSDRNACPHSSIPSPSSELNSADRNPRQGHGIKRRCTFVGPNEDPTQVDGEHLHFISPSLAGPWPWTPQLRSGNWLLSYSVHLARRVGSLPRDPASCGKGYRALKIPTTRNESTLHHSTRGIPLTLSPVRCPTTLCILRLISRIPAYIVPRAAPPCDGYVNVY